MDRPPYGDDHDWKRIGDTWVFGAGPGDQIWVQDGDGPMRLVFDGGDDPSEKWASLDDLGCSLDELALPAISTIVITSAPSPGEPNA
jgi:hypothetical protein